MALTAALDAAGHDLLHVVRRPPTGSTEVQWDPEAGTIDGSLEGVEAIVHLAGENIGQRWTDDVRRRVLDSRVNGTTLIAETAAGLASRPVLICASATGFYGDRGDEIVDEDSVPGTGFLAEVVEAWEAAAEPARAAGLRTVHLRQGIVLAKDGGALARLLPPFKLGAGGRVGSGRQWWSWVSLDDTVAAYLFALEQPLAGPVNVVAPGVVTNQEFVKALGRACTGPPSSRCRRRPSRPRSARWARRCFSPGSESHRRGSSTPASRSGSPTSTRASPARSPPSPSRYARERER